jgi:copper chaperone NosL
VKAVLAAAALGIAGFVVAVVFLWPGPSTGPEAIAYGRDACAHCRMHLARPGWAGELRDRSGRLTKYDDLGCLVRAMLEARAEIPEAWVEDHATGELVPLLAAHLVQGDAAATPMGSGLVAFRDEEFARAFADAGGGRPVRLEDVLRDATRLAQRDEDQRRP